MARPPLPPTDFKSETHRPCPGEGNRPHRKSGVSRVASPGTIDSLAVSPFTFFLGRKGA